MVGLIIDISMHVTIVGCIIYTIYSNASNRNKLQRRIATLEHQMAQRF